MLSGPWYLVWACSILNQKQHLMPPFTLTGHDHSISLTDCVPLCLSSRGGTGDYHRSWITEGDHFINVFTVLLSTSKGIVTVNRSQGWLICSYGAPEGHREERDHTQIQTYVYRVDSKHLVERQHSKKPCGHRKKVRHTQWELMKLSSTSLFHNPTGMLISCGPQAAKTHRYTHLHTHLYRETVIMSIVWEVKHSTTDSCFMMQLARWERPA